MDIVRSAKPRALEANTPHLVDEAIRRADADGTRTGNFHSNSPAVIRSVSTEAVARCRRRRRGPCQRQVLARETDFIVALLNLSELFFPNQAKPLPLKRHELAQSVDEYLTNRRCLCAFPCVTVRDHQIGSA
jgi:hypothetical protein